MDEQDKDRQEQGPIDNKNDPKKFLPIIFALMFFAFFILLGQLIKKQNPVSKPVQMVFQQEQIGLVEGFIKTEKNCVVATKLLYKNIFPKSQEMTTEECKKFAFDEKVLVITTFYDNNEQKSEIKKMDKKLPE